MSRLVFIVEGDTEILLIEKLVVPYLYQNGLQIPCNCQTIITNRKQHKKGGVGSYGKFKNEVIRTLSQPNVIVSSVIDFFRLPTDFPAYSNDVSKIDLIENAIWADLGCNKQFVPYIQKHEVEALMFADSSGFDFIIDSPQQMTLIAEIIASYPNPENINNSPESAPSKRLEKIFNYDKTRDGEMIFSIIQMEQVLKKCPRFKYWIEKLQKTIEQLS